MRRYRLVLLVPSVALLFLPYTSGVSPWETVAGWRSPLGVFAVLGGPFFLAIPILIAQTCVLLKRRFSRSETMTYWSLACTALAGGLAFLGLILRAGASREDILRVSVFPILCAAAVWMMVLSARKLNREEATTAMLRAAWLPNAMYCAILFWPDWQIGAYLAAFTATLYAAEITFSMRKRLERARF